MTYWINLFTGETWQEFISAGAIVSGFRENQYARCKPIKPGDVFLCYCKGISRWIAALEVKSECFRDERPVWSVDTFPIRFKVAPIITLELETAVPVHDLLDDLTWDRRTWTGHVRGSPARIAKADGDVIMRALKEAKENPEKRPFDPKKLRSVQLYKLKPPDGAKVEPTLVTVPDQDDPEETPEQI